MRTFIFKTMLLPISLLAACNSKIHEVKDFIPGTYVNQAQSAYSIANDTVQITPDTLTGNAYHIVRKTGFCRVSGGKLQPEEHKIKSFTGIWDGQKQTVTITQNGIILVFQPGGSKLKIENSEYRKL